MSLPLLIQSVRSPGFRACSFADRESREFFVGLEKVILVCSESCGEVEKCLLAACRTVAKVDDGQEAISRARRETFDAAVLVSTGGVMDLAETALNLRDIRHSIQIIIVADHLSDDQNIAAKEIVLQSVPKTIVVTMERLRDLLDSLNYPASRKKA